MYPDSHQFSWWDYRAGAFNYNKGMRIDHILVNPKAADSIVSCSIDAEPRGKEKASDHTPVLCEVML
jgi:exodeoxyribonuclease-3